MSFKTRRVTKKRYNLFSRIIYLPLFLIAVGIGFFISTSVAPKTYLVKMTDTGFEPETVTIKKGTTVTWKIEGENVHWPASDFHPTHGIYPEKGGCLGSKLDACHGLETGETYSFKFDKEGTWGIHDHLFPGLMMQVVVGKELKDDTDPLTVESFRKKEYDTQKKIIKEMAQKDPKDAWEFVKKVFIKNGAVVDSGHMLAHIVGNEAYSKYGFNGISACGFQFAYGCIHGVTEKMLLVKGIGSIKEIESECLKIWPPEKSLDFSGCIHGAGHGLLGWRGLDVSKALTDCDNFNRHEDSCYDGVFMEHATSAPKSLFDQKDIWKLCRELEEKYHSKCAKYQVIILRQKFNLDYPAIVKICMAAPNSEFYENCVIGMSQYAVSDNTGRYDAIIRICKLLPDTPGYNNCIINASESIAFQQFKNWQATSQKLCNTLNSETGIVKCYSVIERVKRI